MIDNEQGKMKIKEELTLILKDLVRHGYKCYTTTKGNWGYIITPNNNVLYIQYERFSGWTFSLQYKPSRKCGSGCQCLENPVDSVLLEVVQQAEKEGLVFAHKLGAPLYKNSDEWMKGYWATDSLEEIT